jgi:hypothetical protein
VTPSEAAAATEALTARVPQLVVDDTAVFERRWRDDKVACASEADARRRA